MEPTGEIRRRTEACQSLFSDCLSNSVFSELDWFENRQGEFNLWAASLKAVSIGRSSLDHRLRDSPEVQELIRDLLGGLSEALASLLKSAKPKPLTSTPEPEADLLLESEEDLGSVFSGFSTDGDDTGSLPSIGKADGPFSEQMFNVKTILGQLTRISTAIRRSGAKYRYQKADATLKEELFKDFKTHLTFIILMGSIEANTEEPANTTAMRVRITDPKRLTAVQERLIRANIVRRNRIKFATRFMKRVKKPVAQQPQQPPPRIIKLPDATDKSKSRLPQIPAEAIVDRPIIPPQTSSIIAPSITQTATEMGSQFNWQQVAEPKNSSPSVVTRVTRTGAAQDYPSCPKPIPDGVLQCPYCADLLSDSYSQNASRWMGHVAQDILPYMCIYENCETPDKMYLTSDELLKHMRSQHGVACWVCDYCASKPEADQRFIFKYLEDWEFHMKKKHDAAFPPSQLPSLAKVSERRMLESLACPLCGYAAEHPQSTLDDHIAKHLHGFALRCLPSGTGGSEKDSVNAKPADASDSSEPIDENGEDLQPAYLNLTEADTPTQLYEILKATTVRLLGKPHLEDCPTWPYDKQLRKQLLSVEERFLEYLSVAESAEKHQAEQLTRQRSHLLALADLFAPAGLMSSHEQNRMSGEVGSYTLDPSSIFPRPENRLLEVLRSHMLKITHILYQAFLRACAKRPSNAFELYCEKTVPILVAKVKDDSVNIEEKLAQGWKDLSNNQRDEFQRKSEVEGENLTMLEDELDALDTTLSVLANNQGLEHSNKALDDYLNKATGLWNVALTLEDSETYEAAERRLQEAIRVCESAVGNDHPHTLMSIEKLALMYKKSQQWKEAEKLLVQVIQKRRRVQGASHPNTLSSMAELALIHRDQEHLKEAEKLEIMIHLLKQREDNTPITEEEAVQITGLFDEEVVMFLFELRGDDIQITEGIVIAAAGNRKSGKEVMKILLEQRGNEVQITKEVVEAAAKNAISGDQVMRLLLDQREDEVQITEETVKAAAKNEVSGESMMMLLLERKGDKVQITEEVVEIAAGNEWRGDEIMRLLLDQRGDEVQITNEVMKAAAGNKWKGDKVIRLLLDQREDEVQNTEEIIIIAAGNKRSGKEIVRLLTLFEQRKGVHRGGRRR